MKKQLFVTLLGALLMVSTPAFSENNINKAGRKPAVLESSTTSITATVVSVDYKKRLVTVASKDGTTQQIELAQEVKNIRQIKVGDSVSIELVETMAVFVEKSAGKKLRKQSFETVKVALPNQKTVQTRVKVEELTASVESVDLEKRVIIMKFPNGNKQTFFVPRTTKNLDKLKTDDQILFRYTKSKGVSLVKNRQPEATAAPVPPPEKDQKPADSK